MVTASIVIQHNSRVSTAPVLADSPLDARVERKVPKLARAMVEAFVHEIPLYAMLPAEQLQGEILAITTANLRQFFSSLREGRDLTVDELTDVRSSAARRAEERVPLDAVLVAYHVGGRIGWQALVDDAQPDEYAALIAAGARVLHYVQQVTAAVASAYLEEQQTIYGEERDAQRALASALLTGEPGDALAARLGVRLASSYLVVALALRQHPDEGEPGVGGAIAARRKVRRVQAGLEEIAGEPVLSLLDPSGGSVLLPLAVGSTADIGALVQSAVTRLTAAAGAGVLAGAAAATGIGDVARAGRQALDVVRLARQIGKPDGGYLLRDVLLEYQLTRPSDAHAALRELLDPLDRNPDLQHTLEVYLANDLDRRQTATTLHVHPNTLDYRLRRIVELTGLDPSTSRGLQLLGAALAARQLGDARHT
jgi:hypothetical protein